MLFKQIKYSGDNFSYIIADELTKEAAVVDPSYNTNAIIKIVNKDGLKVSCVINTHRHMDHIAGNRDLESMYGSKIVAYRFSKIEKDIGVIDGDIINVGKIAIKVIYTPGHTSDSICLLFDKKLITGDTLFIGECGRTDMPGSSSKDMYNSLFNKIMKLDDDIEVYPGHDYGHKPYSTIGEEKRTNYTLEKRSQQEFIDFMKEP